MKNITLEKLKELEAEEYKELCQVSSLRYKYEREENPRAVTLREAEAWQRGRWGMLTDIIEELTRKD